MKSNDRSKEKLYDELQDLKKKLKEQQRLNKDIDDKYCRYKDCLYRSKTQLNKLLDDYNDTIKRSQPQKTTPEVTTKPSEQQQSSVITAPVDSSSKVEVVEQQQKIEQEKEEKPKEQNDSEMVIDTDATPQEL